MTKTGRRIDGDEAVAGRVDETRQTDEPALGRLAGKKTCQARIVQRAACVSWRPPSVIHF